MREKLIENFLRISNIPRKSGSEKQISDFFVDIAKSNNLYYYQDNNYNLLIKKKGNIQGDTISFQAHFDMVCVKKDNSNHNFDTDPIDVVIDGDKVVAKDTTLGADQGVGLAIMLTLIEDKTLDHPDLEFLFTIEEETTFKGAITFPYDKVESKKMINLDHCKDDGIVVLSAGDIVNEYVYNGILSKKEMPSYKIIIDNLPGGNSGEKIKESSNNAITTIARILKDKDIYIRSIDGGFFENDVATNCEIVLQTDLDLKKIIDNTNIKIEQINNNLSFSKEDTNNIINEIINLKSGFISDTSSGNLGIIKTDNDKVIITYMFRSVYEEELNEIDKSTKNLDYKFVVNNFYSDSIWRIDKNSELLDKFRKVYYKEYKEYPKDYVVQGGLEITSIQKRIKGLDIISIGANMNNFHTINEVTYISSWEKIYNLLVEFLKQ